MTIADFTTKALAQFTEELTDQLFLFVERDRALMSDYLHLLQGKELETVNAHIAQAVKRHFALQTKNERCERPSSKLIQGYERFVK